MPVKQNKGTIITRKIELYIDEEDKDRRVEQWRKLRALSDETYRAANFVASEQYFNRIAEQRYVEADGTVRHLNSEIRKAYKKEPKEKIDLLKAQQKEAQQMARGSYGTSPQNVTYQILSGRFPHVPASILTAINTVIFTTLGKEWNEIERGERSLRTYRRGMPIPFHDSNEDFRRARFEEVDGEIFFNWLDGIRFRLNFGRDRSNNRDIIQRVLAGTYGLSDSSLQVKDKKIFLLLCVRIPEVKYERDQNLALGVDLGINVPAYWALSEGLAHYPIGTRKDLLDFRTRTAARRRQLSGALKITQGGKGRKKKLKALDRYQKSERNYVHTYNHNVSREVINAANKYNVGTIKLELLEGYGRDEEGKPEKTFLLRNWSYYELQKMIEDKAKREGIDVKYIDPYHTSKECALCGALGERPEQAVFICKNPECPNFETKTQADYNAALNIARSTKYVTSKDECQYWRREGETKI